MLDHPQNAIVGFSLIFKFGLDPIYNFGHIAILYFFLFWLEISH